MISRIFLPVILIFLTLWSTPAYAQQEQQDQGEQGEAAMLPNISPQDIEIRGEFKARFPGLERQPILGFDPNMRIHQIDPNRIPFMETDDEMASNLPISQLSRPAPPTYQGLQYVDDVYTFSRIGVGSYTSPAIQFWGAIPISSKSYFGGDFNFSSSDGYLDDRLSSFRTFNVHGEFGTQLDEKTNLWIYVGGQNDFNYAARFADTFDPVEDVRISHEGVNAGAELERFKNKAEGWTLQANVRSFITIFDTQEPLYGNVDEVIYNGSFSNQWALGNPNETFTLKASAEGGNYEAGGTETEQWATLQGGVVYERLFAYRTNVYAEADVYYASNPFESKVYPGGLIKLNHWFGGRLKITGKLQGRPQMRTIEQHHEFNRFLGYENTLKHTYFVNVTGEASIKYYRGSKLHGGVQYVNATDYAYYLPTSMDSNMGTLDLYSIQYQNMTNMKLYAGITHQLMPERFWVSAEAYVQNPELENGDAVPFEESWGVNASVSARPIERITVEGWAHYVSDRKTGVEEEEVDAYLTVGGQLDVEITKNIGAYVKLVNLLGQEYEVWEGYQERPFQVYGGLTLTF